MIYHTKFHGRQPLIYFLSLRPVIGCEVNDKDLLRREIELFASPCSTLSDYLNDSFDTASLSCATMIL